MAATAEHYAEVLEEVGLDTEATFVVVTGATREEVAEVLGVDLGRRVALGDAFEEDHSAYALLEVAGGVLAAEPTGYADPSLEALRRLSAGGRTAAVARSNVQAHDRFGFARDGRVVLDADEYVFLEDPSTVPAELRPLFDQAWIDLDAEDPAPAVPAAPVAGAEGEEDEGPTGPPDALAVALAMVEQVTGVALTVADLDRLQDVERYWVASLTYEPAQRPGD
ncbi:DUF6461 domain-containing protein [Nocardioides sp. Leaf285]|uniref:DUF6461 domain-containing protein n=1 Tax=Nocardioides sp. Leaf285 TaxID=1736322 RepID=UPI000702A40D|nr:DUF6461 domain-containing protein [Nocardioides sp. Leaf285]KQP66568.1 hypothetical protein ASF47_01955 [Nocardioides sp. Leaf285]